MVVAQDSAVAGEHRVRADLTQFFNSSTLPFLPVQPAP